MKTEKKIKQKTPKPPRERPRVINLEITNFCNLACPMCARTTSMTRPTKHMDVELFKKIVDEAAENKIPLKMHQFGEAFLHPKLFEMLSYASEKNVSHGFSTNATLLNEKNAKKILETKVHGVILSLDAGTAETYNMVRAKPSGSSFEFDKVMDQVENFLKLHRETKSKMKVKVMMVDMPMKADEVKIFKERWDPYVNDKTVTYHFAKFTDYAGTIDDVEQFGFSEGNNDRIKDRTSTKRKACGEIRRDMTIQSDGYAVACCYDVNGVLKLGNVNKNSIVDIWHGKAYKVLREKHAKKDFSSLPLCDQCGVTYKHKKPEKSD